MPKNRNWSPSSSATASGGGYSHYARQHSSYGGVSEEKWYHEIREQTPDNEYETNALAPDFGLLDDSQSVFDDICRTPTPEPRERSLPPGYYEPRSRSKQVLYRAPSVQADLISPPGQFAAAYDEASLDPHSYWGAAPSSAESLGENGTIGPDGLTWGDLLRTEGPDCDPRLSAAGTSNKSSRSDWITPSDILDPATVRPTRRVKQEEAGSVRRSERNAQNPKEAGFYSDTTRRTPRKIADTKS
ncbi:hypothetical protein C8Q76DRAFT_694804 [Earliella scabrosa]|nr:hypothetical protein C8Q76DRAFT_694804 [Earliella scabrosa]